MPAPHEEKPFKTHPGRSWPQPKENFPVDKHGRSLQTQHDPSMPDWGRDSENRLRQKRNANGPQGIIR